MKHVHHYTEIGGFYLGSTPARISPMEPDKYLVPRCATLVEPPADLQGMVRVFDGTAWGYQDAPAEAPAGEGQ